MSQSIAETRTDRPGHVRTPAGETAGSVELPAEVFDAKANVPLMHQVVVAQLAAARQGTHTTKTRGEVRGGGKKPYRQKGTGRARQGSTRAPQFAGGGVVHGPQPRDYAQRTPKKMKAAALRGALSDRARDGRVHVRLRLRRRRRPVDQGRRSARSTRSPPPSTSSSCSSATTSSTGRACATCREVHLLEAGQLNTYDVLVSDDVVFTEAALDEFLAGPAAAQAGAEAGSGRARRDVSDRPTGRGRPSRRRPTPTPRAEDTTEEERHDRPRPARRPARPGHLREELRPARREQVHVRRAPGRQQDPDQDRRREDLQRQGRSVNTLNRQGKRKRTRARLRAAQGHQARHRHAVADGDRIEIFGGPGA